MSLGKYGICEDCEIAIPTARLKALPYATRCIKCQRRSEAAIAGDADEDVDWKKLINPEDM